VELEREIARARRAEQPLVLAFVDVDGLKAINDSRGHGAGDRVLRDVANALRASLRSHDLIIRFGGDEFACVIAGLNTADATERLDLVNSALAGAPEPASTTVGVAELQPNDSSADQHLDGEGTHLNAADRDHRSAARPATKVGGCF
jgi:diguanylate cyclase (GGDEF)-like protein